MVNAKYNISLFGLYAPSFSGLLFTACFSCLAFAGEEKDIHFPQHTGGAYVYPNSSHEIKSLSVDFQFSEDPDTYTGHFVFSPIQARIGDDLFYFMINFSRYHCRMKPEHAKSVQHLGSAFMFRKFGVESTDVLRPSKVAKIDIDSIEGKISSLLVPGNIKAGQYTLTVRVQDKDKVDGKSGHWINAEVYIHKEKKTVDIGAIFFQCKTPKIEKPLVSFFEAVQDPRPKKNGVTWPTKPIVVGNWRIDEKPLEIKDIAATYPLRTVCETDCSIVTKQFTDRYTEISPVFVKQESVAFEFPLNDLDRTKMQINESAEKPTRRFYIERLK